MRLVLLSLFFVLLAFAQCIAINSAFTNTIKNYVGRHRPNFFALCDYAGFVSNRTEYEATTVAGAYGDIRKCKGTPSDIEEGQLSFPSGHASYSFAGLFLATLYLRALFRIPSRVVFSLPSVLSFAPTVLAGYIALTRIRDRYHNPDDVAVGSLIGIVSAWLAWHHFVTHRRDTLLPVLEPPLPLAVRDAVTGKVALPVDPLDSTTPKGVWEHPIVDWAVVDYENGPLLQNENHAGPGIVQNPSVALNAHPTKIVISDDSLPAGNVGLVQRI
jgi:membrane-associated phospholipid phosphatase